MTMKYANPGRKLLGNTCAQNRMHTFALTLTMRRIFGNKD
jgi:hypothetical protein